MSPNSDFMIENNISISASRKCAIVLIAFMLLSVIFPYSIIASAEEDEERILKVGFIEYLDSANPFIGLLDISYVFYGMVYSWLNYYDEDLEIAPSIAESWWCMDGPTAASQEAPTNFSSFAYNDPEDWPLGSVWEFNLSDNMFWSDGERLTAEDAVWSTNIQIGANYMTYWAYQPYTRWIYKAELVSDLKFRLFFANIENKEPFQAAFGYSVHVPILPKHIFEDKPSTYLAFQWDGTPVIGSGPFIGTDNLKEEIIAGDWVTLLKNPYYNFEDDDGVLKGIGAAFNRSTQIDKLIMKFFSEESTLSIALRTGEIDCAQIEPTTYLNWLNDESTPDRLEMVSLLSALGNSKLIAINAYPEAPGSVNPLRLDPAVLRAASLATDKTYIINQFYKGLATEGYHLIATPIWEEWYWEPGDELSTFYVNDSEGNILYQYTKPLKDVMSYDVEVANEILDAAGYNWSGEEGASARVAGDLVGDRMWALFGIPKEEIVGRLLNFEVITDYTNQKDRQIAHYMELEWVKTGIEVVPRYVDQALWMNIVYTYNFDIQLTYWSGDVDPNYLCYITTSYALYGWNDFGVCSEEYDNLYLNQTRAFDYESRKYWVDECSKWQYLSGSVLATVYPQYCFGFNNDTWTNWGDWAEHPGLVLNHFWGDPPLYLNLQYTGGVNRDNMAEIAFGIAIAVIAISAISISIIRKRRKRLLLEEEEQD